MKANNISEKNITPSMRYIPLVICTFLILLVIFNTRIEAPKPNAPISVTSSSSVSVALPKPAHVQTVAEKQIATKKAHELAVRNNRIARSKLEDDKREARIQKEAAFKKAKEQASLLKAQLEDEEVYSEIKSKMRHDYPDDYISQKGVYDMEVEAYQFMKSLPDDEIKSKMVRDYPGDYISQKGVYEMEVKARDEMR